MVLHKKTEGSDTYCAVFDIGRSKSKYIFLGLLLKSFFYAAMRHCVDRSSCFITFSHSFLLFLCPSVQMAPPQSLIWLECGPMSAWHRRWCQLDNDKIASDLSGIAFIVVIGVIYCSDVLKLCHDLLGTLPLMLIGLATNCDRSHR